MKEKDKLKLLVALSVLGSIAASYFIWGKEISKYVAVAGFVIWLGTMYFTNKEG